MSEILRIIYLILLFYKYSVHSAPQQSPEISDQFKKLNHTEVDVEVQRNMPYVDTNTVIEDRIPEDFNGDNKTEILDVALVLTDSQPQPSFVTKFYISIKAPILRFMAIPRVNAVLRNVGTCIVNGVMELVSFYVPAPMIPLLASAAGVVIPFEPVVTLRRRMPVTSYRRAFSAAMNSFMGTFDRYKEPEDDPYMTRRFNRRFLGDDKSPSLNPLDFEDKEKDFKL